MSKLKVGSQARQIIYLPHALVVHLLRRVGGYAQGHLVDVLSAPRRSNRDFLQDGQKLSPLAPASPEETGLSQALVADLALKHMYQRGPMTATDLSAALCLPMPAN